MPTAREEALKRIEKKRGEIVELEMQIREATSYIQALEDLLKLLPKEANSNPRVEVTPQSLRPGSVVARAREAILEAGRPLHINEILTALGKSTDNVTRAGVSGSISAYFRKGEVFTRPAPNTFGLLELPVKSSAHQQNGTGAKHAESSPPNDFGLDFEADETDTQASNDEEFEAV